MIDIDNFAGCCQSDIIYNFTSDRYLERKLITDKNGLTKILKNKRYIKENIETQTNQIKDLIEHAGEKRLLFASTNNEQKHIAKVLKSLGFKAIHDPLKTYNGTKLITWMLILPFKKEW